MSDLHVVSRQNKNLTVEVQKYSELSQDLKMYGQLTAGNSTR